LSGAYYLNVLCEYLQAVAEGKMRRLCISLPPRCLKSTLATVILPTWIWAVRPHTKFLFHSWNVNELTTTLSVQRRALLQSTWYQMHFGSRFTFREDENQKALYTNSAGGRMQVVAGSTGLGGNFVVADDVISVDDCRSEVKRKAASTFIRESLLTRLDHPQEDCVLVIGQRLAEDDPIGSLLTTGGWEYLALPAVVTEQPQVIHLPLSGKTWTRPVGDMLDPNRLDSEFLAQQKRDLGSLAYFSQYQQEPQPSEGNIVSPKWLNWYEPAQLDMSVFDEIVISCDPSVKDTGDDVACQVWGMSGSRNYLLALDSCQRNFASTKAFLRSLNCQWHRPTASRADLLLLEDKAGGSFILEEFRQDANFGAVIPINPTLDKVARLQTCFPLIEARTVYLPNNETGQHLAKLLCAAPNVTKWDTLDAASQFLNWRRGRGAVGNWLKGLAEQVEREARGETNPVSDQSAYSSSPAPTLKHQYDDFRLQNDMPICKQPDTPVLPVPKKPGVTCPSCNSSRVLLAGISAKCRNCRFLFTPGLRRN
jgi:hypothetical protein